VISKKMRIVFSTFGTFCDVNPLIALALEMKRRGHRPVLAVPEMFRPKIEPLGIGFFPVRPDQDQTDKELVARIYNRKTGTEYGLRKFLFPALRQSYEDLRCAVEADGGADLMVTGELAYAGPVVAEKTGIAWASYVLAPFSFFSAYDPPVLPPFPTLAKAQLAVPWLGHLTAWVARRVTHSWPEPVYALRRELGLGRGKDPIFDAKHSGQLVLALFSRVFGAPQPDWPAKTKVTGFVFYDGDAGKAELPPALGDFLAAGPPPLVFTLGSAAVLDAGDFYEQSARAAQMLGMRAVLLTGSDPANMPKAQLPESICIAPYAPYSRLFPRACAIVHQGGIGTTAQAMRAGRPMVVMPYSHDQPDNARRVRRMGVAKIIQRRHYTAERVARVLRALLEDAGSAERARKIQREMEQEDGLTAACDALEGLGTRPHRCES